MNTEMVRLILGYGYAFFVTGISFWFLFKALLDLNTAVVPENQLTVLITACFGLINLAAGAVIQQIASAQATRAAERSAAAGANAALQTPPGPPLPSPPDSEPTLKG
jgi:hypothetical protein